MIKIAFSQIEVNKCVYKIVNHITRLFCACDKFLTANCKSWFYILYYFNAVFAKSCKKNCIPISASYSNCTCCELSEIGLSIDK